MNDFNLEELISLELADLSHNPFGITEDNFRQAIDERSQYFKIISPEVIQLCNSLGLKDKETVLKNLWRLWLPLAIQLKEAREKLERTLIQGILGGQGAGKSTLTVILKLILGRLGYSVANLSIDDLYLTYIERQQLQEQDPRLIWRGPPGTHDVDLGLRVIEKCLQGDSQQPILMPRFDKSAFQGAGDRDVPEIVKKVDILLFEGWFVGVQPIIDESVFDHPPLPIVTPEDKQFARDNNQRLKAYLPLWEKLDRLLVFNPVDYRLSLQWRKEAEHKIIATGKSGMSDEEIDRFVEYFWKSLHPELFITPLIDNSELTDLVVDINRDRTIAKIYRP